MVQSRFYTLACYDMYVTHRLLCSLCNVRGRRVLGHNRRELRWDAKANIEFELYKLLVLR